jgi:hypothetical protein
MKTRDRRALAMGTVAIILSVAILRVFPWLAREHAGLRTSTEQRVATLVRTRAAVASVPALRDSLARGLDRFVQVAPNLIGGNSPGEAAASLSGTINLYAEQSSVRLIRLEPIADSTTDVISPVSVVAELEGDVAGLSRFLASVETGLPILTVRDLAVRSRGTTDRRTPQVLAVAIKLTGWFMPEANR